MLKPGDSSLKIREVVGFLFDDVAGSTLWADRLWPQLWAMARVEPVLEELLDEIYIEYLQILEELLIMAGSRSPRAEALGLMSLI